MVRFRHNMPKLVRDRYTPQSATSSGLFSRCDRPISNKYLPCQSRLTLPTPSIPVLINKRSFTNSSSVFRNSNDDFKPTSSPDINNNINNQDPVPFNGSTTNNINNNNHRFEHNPDKNINNNNNNNNNNDNISNNKNNNVSLKDSTLPDKTNVLPLPPNPSANLNDVPIHTLKQQQQQHQQRNILRQANQNISATLHYAGQSIEELENMLMKRLNENNKRRFRMYFFGSFSALIILLYVFGGDIRKMVSAQTADFAKETLENESLQVQTQQLAMAVVQTILNDPQVTAMAASFLKEASTAKETQLALLELVSHVLHHPQSLQELTTLSEQLLQRLTQQPHVQQQLITLLNSVLMDEKFQVVLVQVLHALFQHPEIVQAMSQCFAQVFQQQNVQETTQKLMTSAAQELLADEQVMEESRRFIADVMGDDSLQKEGGDALWNSLNYALKPGFIKITGVMLIGLSIGAFRLFISPF